MPDASKETKEFWRTSEFWTMVATQLGAIIAMLDGVLPAKYGVPTMAALTMFYNIARGIAKSGNPVPPVVQPQVLVEVDTGETPSHGPH